MVRKGFVAAVPAVTNISCFKRALALVVLCFVITASNSYSQAVSHTICSSGECCRRPGSFSVIETSYATGPQIKVVEPSPEREYRAPIKLIIAFLPKDGTQVDLKSFRLEYLKLISIDITEKVAKYLRPEGLRVDEADLPPGEHRLRMTLRDSVGGITQQVYSVRIAK